MARTDDDTWDLASSVGATATMIAASRAMAKALREWLRMTRVSAICLHKGPFGAWYARYIG